jgi:MoxR-like ATPase
MTSFGTLAAQYQLPIEKDQQAEDIRQQFLAKFPASRLSDLTLEQYALGLERKSESLCYWLEFKTRTLGLMPGGDAFKYIVFYRKKENKWEFESKYRNEEEALDKVREGLVTLVHLAEADKYEELESVEPFRHTNSYRVKLLSLYFPDKFLPISSIEHLKSFCLQFGIETNFDSQISMNRALMQFKAEHEETKDWSGFKFMRFLYEFFPPAIQFWKIAPGDKARLWSECKAKGIICMGWDEVGDVSQYESAEDFKEAFLKHKQNPGAKWRELWNFATAVKDGDVIVANNGLATIVGTGKCEGEYYYDSTRPEYRHCLKVKWESVQEYAIPLSAQDIVSDWAFKTLKKILREDLARLSTGISKETTPAAYLLAWNPEKWNWTNLRDLAEQYHSDGKITAGGEDNSWTVANKGVQPGDRLFLVRLGKEPKGLMGSGWATTSPYQDAHYDENNNKNADYVKVEWDALLDPQRDKLLPLAHLQESFPNIHWTPQSSGIAISAEAIGEIEKAWKAHLSKSLPSHYSLSTAIQDIFMDSEEFAEIFDLARRRRNIVLQGPPGVGKTYIAKRLAYALLGIKDDSRLGWVQFHQSYSYEDFIFGFRPNGLGFELKQGIFHRFCEQASQDSRPHVFVIDEINRGNLSRIFGEALSAIEDDKRGELSVTLAYQSTGSDGASATKWTVPPNLILIGLMNTADRSLAVVDYALRRRFAFVDLEPQFDSPQFDRALASNGLSPTMRENIRTRMKALNSRISSDKRNLGRGFEIGHSFFCPKEPVEDETQWFRNVIKFEIKPLIAEYYFDDHKAADLEIGRLLSGNSD